MADVSDKLLAQFSQNLNTLISTTPDLTATATAAPAPTSTGDAAVGDDVTAPSEPVVRKIDGPEAQPINLLDAAGAPLLKRALPVVAGIAVLVVVLIALL
jgi:hypothetical protein